MKKHYYFLLLAGTAFSFQSKNADIPLATVGPITISQQEFQHRYELTPGLQRHRNSEANKAEFLLSLIAEKILVIKAQESGMENDTAVLSAVNEIERNFVRDELYRREIMNKVSVSEQEIERAYKKSLIDNKVYFIVAQSKHSADSLIRTMGRKPLEQFSAGELSSRGYDGPDSAMARWGDGDERMEALVYALKLNETSQPLQLDDGWYIVKLMGREITVLEGKSEKESQREKVVSVLRRRKEILRMNEFMHKELRSTSTSIDASQFKNITETFWNEIQQKGLKLDTATVYFDAGMEESILRELRNGNQPFISFPHTVWDVKKTLDKVTVAGLAVPSPTFRTVALSLEQRLKDLIDQEYLTMIGYRQKLNQSLAVMNDMKVWRDALVSQFVREQIEDTVNVSQSDIDEIKKIFTADSLLSRSDSLAREKSRSIKNSAAVDRIIGTMANELPITIYQKNLKETEVSKTPSMVFRLLGFGGRMFAAPFVTPQLGWINYWNKKDLTLP